MCGRFSVNISPQELIDLFGINVDQELTPRFNVAPTQNAPVIIQLEGRRPRLVQMKWGLIPSWSRDASLASKLINARSETVLEKPSFRTAFKRRRCAVPISGFFEWKKVGTQKQPHYIFRQDGHILLLAGLWERWRNSDQESVESFTILTTAANHFMSGLHERMPVILEPSQLTLWLDPSNQDTSSLVNFFHPAPESCLTAYPVSSYVNSVANSGPTCIEPVSDPDERQNA